MKKTLDWNQYKKTAIKAVEEGCVLLQNDNAALPLEKGSEIALFGRMQSHYYKSGTGSGGMVNVDRVVNIRDAILESGDLKLNEEIDHFYMQWEQENPYNNGVGWGQEPWSQVEAILPGELLMKVSLSVRTAVAVIARTAGEDKDNKNLEGSYKLSQAEIQMLKDLRLHFSKVVVLLNVGNTIDYSFIDLCNPDAVLLVWQGGMIGGYGVANLLTGKAVPSGHLTDTIAYQVSDYPSDANFGEGYEDVYEEDIYVGYRYFETFAKEKVRFPFGYGLSYTKFELKPDSFTTTAEGVSMDIRVTNVGNFVGKECVQVYMQAPQGRMGRPYRILVGFAKTDKLMPRELQTVSINIPYSYMATFDDSGATGYPYCNVCEAGEYKFYIGSNVRNTFIAGSMVMEETKIIEKLSQALAPVQFFERIRPRFIDGVDYGKEFEKVPLRIIEPSIRRMQDLPENLSQTGDQGIVLRDVYENRATIDTFIAQFSEEDLACIIRGEGMGSPKVTPGTASAFGAVSESLIHYGLPCACCSDGPSGMRIDCGKRAFSLPNGTMLACTFNQELNEELFALLGMEMVSDKVDVLLGPGMNIHRHPLNGRNFEYFSEDPFLTGKIGAAQLRGLHQSGVTGTIKHFCANNRETKRMDMNSVVSTKALREIYLKGFELAIKEGNADSVMTTYGALNGIWTAGNYELNTTILRKEWGFHGIVMSDWWAKINKEGEQANTTDFATMAIAQNDLYMVCPNGAVNSSGDNTIESLHDGTITIGELQRNAKNICKVLMHTQAFQRLLGVADEIEVIDGPKEEIINMEDVVYYPLEEETIIDLTGQDTNKGKDFVFATDVVKKGVYKMQIIGNSTLSELAQIPLTLFYQGIPVLSFTFNGTGGVDAIKEHKICFTNKYGVYRLYFGQSGLNAKCIKFTFLDEDCDPEKYEDCFFAWT